MKNIPYSSFKTSSALLTSFQTINKTPKFNTRHVFHSPSDRFQHEEETGLLNWYVCKLCFIELTFEIGNKLLEQVIFSEFLAVAQFISVDPYMRAYVKNRPAGGPFGGGQIAK